MWKNIVELGRPQMTIRRMLIACWITKATNTHSEYVIFTAFPLQQWLQERGSMLRYTYIACIVILSRRREKGGCVWRQKLYIQVLIKVYNCGSLGRQIVHNEEDLEILICFRQLSFKNFSDDLIKVYNCGSLGRHIVHNEEDLEILFCFRQLSFKNFSDDNSNKIRKCFAII
jgi:hypothetical protein